MIHTRELTNHNKIISENTCKTFHNYLNNPDYILKFVFDGVEDCNFSNRNIRIFSDSFVVLNAGTDYSSAVDSITTVNTFSLSLSANFVQDFNKIFSLPTEELLDNDRKNIVLFSETLLPFIGDMRYNILHLKSKMNNSSDNEILINEYLHHCLLNYYSTYKKEIVLKTANLKFIKTKTKNEVIKRLLLAKDYINSNFDKNFTLEDISKYCYLSTNHLLRTFKQAFGLSPYQFLIQLRITRAKRLLKTTNYPLNEIVGLIGFENTSSFIRLFKEVTTLTPATFRKQK